MLENLIGKKVFILVSTRSGVSNSVATSAGGSESAINGVCKITGTFSNFDDKFVVVSDAKNYYMNIYDGMTFSNRVSPNTVESINTYIRIDNIIFIAEA